ncbi:Golgi-associated plant pathogenesis-related protein 1 [Drosophila teissieri]|uniref:Golgi-associated plant pathogenesis-related protein 1 n=1 Tax=Drosophila teissieri TaxID=7243 RepID=UPI001CB9DE95|nr:Golgi-associated plant pathogenesis-related protein 1 [Drosophila teissieri]
MALVNILIVIALSLLVVVKADLKEDHLGEHNRLRENHGSPPLELDDELTQGCEAYAKVLAAKEQLEHSSSAGQYGENLCMRSEKPLKCVQDWYDEIKDYDFEKGQFGMGTGHFTALVWKNTKKMGFGQATDKRGYYWVVARYYPPGNVNGQFKENVLPPINGGGDGQKGNFNMVQVNTILIFIMLWVCGHYTN